MEQSKPRVVGLDVHPDSFAGAILEGSDPWSAHVVRTSTRRGEWSPAQAMLLRQLHAGLLNARARRQQLRHYMASEILGAPEFLKLTRLCGISLVTLYGLIAAIGDITRFAQSKKLVAYFGLNPSVCQSGNYEGATALQRHGRGAMRALLVQSAKKLLQVENPLRKWGLAVAARRGRNKAAVAPLRANSVSQSGRPRDRSDRADGHLAHQTQQTGHGPGRPRDQGHGL